jgi:hypothetical protein
MDCALLGSDTAVWLVVNHRFGGTYRLCLQDPPKRWKPSVKLHGVSAQKTTIHIFTAAKTSNFISSLYLCYVCSLKFLMLLLSRPVCTHMCACVLQ